MNIHIFSTLIKKVLSINIHVCQLKQHWKPCVLCLPINAALGFICYYPQVLFLPKVGVTLSTENCTLEAFLLLQLSPLVERERERERNGPERAKNTFNEAHSEVR